MRTIRSENQTVHEDTASSVMSMSAALSSVPAWVKCGACLYCARYYTTVYSIQYTPGEGRQQGPWSCYNVVTTPHCLANCSPDIFISLLWLVTGTVDQLWGGGWVTMSWQTIIVLTRWRPLRWPGPGQGQLVVSTPRLGLLCWGYKDHGKYVIKTLLLL